MREIQEQTVEHAQAPVVRAALAEGDKQYEKAARGIKQMSDDGLSNRAIGRQIERSHVYVGNLLRALESTLSTDTPFAEAYATLNNPPKKQPVIEPAGPDPDYDEEGGWDLPGLPDEVRKQIQGHVEANKELLDRQCGHCALHCPG